MRSPGNWARKRAVYPIASVICSYTSAGEKGCHSFRATAITIYRQRGGSLDGAQNLAGHKQSKTTALYDHSDDEVTRDEIERGKL